MSRFLEIQPKIALTIGLSSVIGAGIIYGSVKLLRNIYNERPPNRWCKVGVISKLYCFPVKSCGPIILDEINCGLLGPNIGHMRDRVFMVVRPNGEYVTARVYPKMVLIMPKIESDVMTLSAPGMQEIKINIAELYTSNLTMETNLFGSEASCIDCGDNVAQWFSEYILGESEGFRLVFYPSSKPKPVIGLKYYYLFDQPDRMDSGALHDETSFMLMNQGSFDDLNWRLEQPVTPLQFRPNFMVDGPQPWEEDSWKWVKIGEETIFKNVQPCIRCVFTTIDPATGVRHPKMEPLNTLRTFRTFQKKAPHPCFGIHLGIRSVHIYRNIYFTIIMCISICT